MGNPFGIVALIMGIIAMAGFWLFGRFLTIYGQLGICIPTAILAMIFGGIGIAKDDSKAMAIIGLVFGAIVIGLLIVILVLLAPFYYISYYY